MIVKWTTCLNNPHSGSPQCIFKTNVPVVVEHRVPQVGEAQGAQCMHKPTWCGPPKASILHTPCSTCSPLGSSQPFGPCHHPHPHKIKDLQSLRCGREGGQVPILLFHVEQSPKCLTFSEWKITLAKFSVFLSSLDASLRFPQRELR